MEFPLVALGAGLLWGGTVLIVLRLFGDHGLRPNPILMAVCNVLLAMAVVYVAGSADASVLVAGVVALAVLALGLFSERQRQTT